MVLGRSAAIVNVDREVLYEGIGDVSTKMSEGQGN